MFVAEMSHEYIETLSKSCQYLVVYATVQELHISCPEPVSWPTESRIDDFHQPLTPMVHEGEFEDSRASTGQTRTFWVAHCSISPCATVQAKK